MRGTRLAGTLLFAATVAGCAHQRMAGDRADGRLNSLAYTAGRLGQSEGDRPPRLARAGVHIDRRLTEDVDRTIENGPETQRRVDADVGRFIDRQPEYRRAVWQKFWARPENWEPVAIMLFY